MWQVLLAGLLLQSASEPSGAAAYLAGQYQQARRLLETDVSGGHATARTYFWLGYTYLALGQRERAIPQFEAYLKDHPKDEDVLYAIARTYAQLSDMSLEQIFVLDPKSARSYQMRGIRYEVESSWKEAIQAYGTALKLDPTLRGAHASIGRIYDAELKDEAAAVREYEAECKIDPGSVEANGFLAAHYRTSQPDRARRHRAAIESAPLPAGEKEQAIYWLRRGSPEKALPPLLRWRTAQPRNVDIYYYLAESYASAHQTPKAIEEYRGVLALQPGLPGVRYELGRLLADTQPEEAIKLLEGELALDPNHYLAAAWLGRI
jgi:tetratricopeptide (TPR) repeat protein